MFCSLTLQKELSFKVQIFEKKVDSYKKMTLKLNNAVEYIKVKLLTDLMMFITHFLYSGICSFLITHLSLTLSWYQH